LKKEPKEFKQQYRLTKKERENNITESREQTKRQKNSKRKSTTGDNLF